MSVDVLKETFWRALRNIEHVSDYLSANEIVDEDDHVFCQLDSAVKAITEALIPHVPGLYWAAEQPMFEGGAYESARTYSDGSPILVDVKLEPGVWAEYWPRYDGDFEAWRLRFKPTLTLL